MITVETRRYHKYALYLRPKKTHSGTETGPEGYQEEFHVPKGTILNMAIHNDLPSVSREAIEEYLAIAHYCITVRKPTGGAYGYPAVLLLFSVVDALSNYAGYPEHSFLVLKDIFPNLTAAQVKHLKNWYRHPPAHEAILMPGVGISVDEPGDPIAITSGEPTHIRLLEFWTTIKNYWDTRVITLNPSYHKQKAPTSPVTLNVSAPSASGKYVNTSTSKK